MKSAVALVLLLSGCASREQWRRPIAFVGIPKKVEGRTYQTVEGREQRLVIKILRVTKGAYDERESAFGFGENELPPLKIGQPYLFEAFYDRHGVHFAKWEETRLEVR